MKSVNDDVGTIPSDGVTDLAATKALYSSTTTLYCLIAVSISYFYFSIPQFDSTISKPEAAFVGGLYWTIFGKFERSQPAGFDSLWHLSLQSSIIQNKHCFW